jgi:hypothetical protein
MKSKKPAGFPAGNHFTLLRLGISLPFGSPQNVGKE